jgi:EmrB/QacA subfamily drug resistance transporter
LSTTQEAPPPAGGSPAEGYSHRQILLIMSGLMMGMLLASLDQTIVSTALTTISRDFHRLDLYGWVITSYLLTSTASTPLYGKISDQFGRKRIFQFAIVVFLLGSVLSGASQSMYQLIIFRGVQGIGAGGLMTLAMAIMGDIISPRQRGRYQGYFGAVFAFSSIIGPLLGGFLVDQASWRWVFYVNLPVGAVALVVVNRVLRLEDTHRRSKIDIVGSVLVVTGVSLFLVGVQIAGGAAKLTPTAYAYSLTGLVCIVVFVWWERRAPEPIIPLFLFNNRVFVVTNVLGFITGTVMFGALIFLPLYFQTVRHLTPTQSGLRLLPMLAGMLICSIGSGRIISRIGRYKGFVIAGTTILAIALALMTTISTTSGVWVISGMLFLVGVGMGCFMQTLVLAVQNALPQRYMGVGTASVTFFRTLGGAIGAAVLGAILVLIERNDGPHYVALYGPVRGAAEAFTHAMDTAFLFALPLAVVSIVLSFALPERRLRGSAEPESGPSEQIGFVPEL